MSWLSKLADTYESGSKLDIPESDKPIPVSHTLQNAHINIVIDGEGNFKRASVLEKTQIVLPATESSAGRSSGEAPHPLADKLQYIAGDYAKFGGKKKPYFDGYKKQLQDWCNSEFSHPMAKAVLKYIEKEAVVQDLVLESILHLSDQNFLLTKWEDENTEQPALFRLLPKEKGVLDQGNAMVCWTVELEGQQSSQTWKDKELQNNWIKFDSSFGENNGFCYVLGNFDDNVPLAVNHPAKLRHTGDKAKLISSNDKSSFTFRGRFITAEHAAGVSFEITQKAHNALRWLISRQGYRNGDQVIVAWAVSGKEIPQPMEDIWSFLNEEIIEKEHVVESHMELNPDHSLDLGQTFAKKLNNYMRGYAAKLNPTEMIVIMGLDSATPGRMGITYYKESFAEEFLDNVKKWHEDFAWIQKRYIDDGNSSKKKAIWSVSSPVVKDIWMSAYGARITDSLKKNVIERITPAIIDGMQIPIDIVNLTFKNVVNRGAYKSDEFWLWEKNLGIACSLYKGHYKRNADINKRKDYKMALDFTNSSRDYLYGRLLAVAEYIEEMALMIGRENRTTTAARLMQYFADRPFSTWRNIELALQPYKQRLYNNRKGFIVNREKELDEIYSKFKGSDFTNNQALSGEFLLAYHLQRLSYKNKDENVEDKNTKE